MKKCLCIVLGIALLAAGIAVGCFCCRPPKPAPPEEPNEPSPPDVILGAGEWTFSFEEDFLMFPTLRGSLVFEEYPDKLTFSYNGEEREIEIADADYKQYFVLEFEQIFLYERIPKGAQTATVYAYKRGEKSLIGTAEIVSEHDYYLSAASSLGGGSVSGMDSEDFWTGNY